MSDRYTTQIAIVGGGVSGLWLLNAALQRGYRAVLIERDSLGCAQTLASQGMIHGGVKYALGGFTTPSSESIAAMPARWTDCIAGTGQIDLSDVSVLSRDYYLFSDRSVSSRVTAFFGSKSLRGRVDPVKRDQYPACFRHKAFRGRVYRLEDLVIDSASLTASLARQAAGRIFKSEVRVNAAADGSVESLRLDGARLVAHAYVFAAGAGNAALMEHTCLSEVEMQRRPLHQVMVKSASLPPIYAHAVSAAAGAKPRVTFTTHYLGSGEPVWYLGGNLAETGVERSETEQIAFAQQEMHALFPWLDWRGAEWRSFTVDRAEPRQKDLLRPDLPFCKRAANAMVVWPTKLTLTPLLADEAMKSLAQHAPAQVDEVLPPLPAPTVGRLPWERAF